MKILKASLTTLMMLVSLSSFSQYPTVKTIGKDTVVIMTVKQGEDINQKFSNLTDSITNLNNSIIKKKSEVALLTGEKQKLDSTLTLSLNNLIVSEKEIKRLNDVIKREDAFLQNERKKWAGWMFFSFMVTVLVGALK